MPSSITPALPRALALTTRATRLGLLLWLLCLQFFVAEQVARLGFHGHYSMATNMISDLGALHPLARSEGASPLHALMNASFIVQGLLIAGGALLVRPLFPSPGLTRAAFVCFVLSGIGVLVVGLAPEDANGDLHLLGAVVHFLCGSLAMLLFGMALLRHTKQDELPAMLSIGAGMLALVATLMLGFSRSQDWSSLGRPLGAVERLAAYPLPVWLAATGYLLLARTGSRARLVAPRIS